MIRLGSARGRAEGIGVSGGPAEGLFIGTITMSGVSAIIGSEGRAMIHRLCHIVERRNSGPRCLPNRRGASMERLSVCGVLCCVKLAVLLVVTVL